MEKERKYSIYLKSTDSFVEVSKEAYYEYYRPIWVTIRKQQLSGVCVCKKNNILRCDGDCADCKYYKPNNVSLESLIEDNVQIESHEGFLSDDDLRVREIISELPENLKIFCQCLMNGCSNSEIKSTLGYKCTDGDFRSYKRRLRNELKKAFAEFDPNNCK